MEDAELTVARADFPDRIGALVGSMGRAGTLDAFCLTVLADTADRHYSTFRLGHEELLAARATSPATLLACGLMAYDLENTWDEERGDPFSKAGREAALVTCFETPDAHIPPGESLVGSRTDPQNDGPSADGAEIARRLGPPAPDVLG